MTLGLTPNMPYALLRAIFIHYLTSSLHEVIISNQRARRDGGGGKVQDLTGHLI